MKNLRRLLILSVTMVGFLLAGTAAKADPLTLTLASPFQSGGLGDVLTFDATVTNTSADVVYLNSDSTSLAGPLVLDDSPFFDDYPLSLNPGDSYTGELFDVTIPTTTADGLYAGNFEILGGGPSDFTDVVASVNFDVYVPEPSSLELLLTGLAALVCLFGLGGTTLRRRTTIG